MADEDIKKCLEIINQNKADVPPRSGRTGTPVSADVIEALYQTAQKSKQKQFTLPLKVLNEMVGSQSEKLRDRTVMEKLNRDSDKIIKNDEEWFIGSATTVENGEKVKVYKIVIRKKKEA
jgi:hypothetical protein